LILRFLDRAVGALAALLVAASAGAICLNVFYRYVVLGWLRNGAESLPWLGPAYRFFDALLAPVSVTADEVPGFMLVWIAFLGAYLAIRQGGHISFDLLVDKLPRVPRRLVRSAVDLAIVVFLGLVFWLSVRMILIDGAREIETAEISQGWFMAILPLASGAMILALAKGILLRWADPEPGD
jgi:TRAP-type C4-dicarboxylate transport system permease small subunit